MKLPSVFVNPIDHKMNNNREYVRGEKQDIKKDLSLLKNKFDKNGYVNRLPVLIKTKDKKIDDKLVLMKKDGVITMHNEKILFDDIIDYEIKK